MTLDPQAQFILDLAERSTRPPLESLDPSAARIQYAEMVAAVAGDPPTGVEVQNGSIPGPGGEMPTRLYRPQDIEGPLPILVYFHGGGYVIGDLDTHDIPWSRDIAIYVCYRGLSRHLMSAFSYPSLLAHLNVRFRG